MTRTEMIEFIKTHPYVFITHPAFADNEYIYSDENGIVWDESGTMFENWDSVHWYTGVNGIRFRFGGMWETDWQIKEC